MSVSARTPDWLLYRTGALASSGRADGGDVGSDLLGMGAGHPRYAFNLVSQRMLALVAKPLEIAFYQNTIVFLMLLVGVPFAVSWPATALQWGGAVLAAAFAVASLMLMSVAYRQVEAQRLVAIDTQHLSGPQSWAGGFFPSPSPHGRFWDGLIVLAVWLAPECGR